MNSTPRESTSSTEGKLPETAGGIHLGRILGTVAGIFVLIVLGLLVNEYLANRPLSYVMAKGRVTWNGKPVTIGAVMTRHVDYPRESAIGAFDSDGNFELITNGKQGAVPGTHKIIVASYGPGMATDPLVPTEYLKPETTPLSILVTSDPSQNHFILEVVGEKAVRQRPPGRPAEEAAAESDPGSSASPASP
ncbi:MAG: hypothetical protein DWH91_15965 [Planctomycetota bacterium]|nr:MAG: hypothetical protein DWH91_15965 [Planctomycetota bacterium]